MLPFAMLFLAQLFMLPISAQAMCLYSVRARGCHMIELVECSMYNFVDFQMR